MKKVLLLAILSFTLGTRLSAERTIPSCYPKSILKSSDFAREPPLPLNENLYNIYSRDGFKGKVKSIEDNGHYIEYDKAGRIVTIADVDFLMPASLDEYIYKTNKRNHTISVQLKYHGEKEGKWDKGILSGTREVYNENGWLMYSFRPSSYTDDGYPLFFKSDTLTKIEFDENGYVTRVYDKGTSDCVYSYKEDGIEYILYRWDNEKSKMSVASRAKFDKYGFKQEIVDFDNDTISYMEKYSYDYSYYPTGELKTVTKYLDGNKEKVEYISIYDKNGVLRYQTKSVNFDLTYYPTGKINTITCYTNKNKEKVEAKATFNKNGYLVESQGQYDSVKNTFDNDGHPIDMVTNSYHYVYNYNKGYLEEEKTYRKSSNGERLEQVVTYDQYGNRIKSVRYNKEGKVEDTVVNKLTYF